MDNQTEESALTLKEILYIVRRHIILEAAIVFIGVLIGVIISLTNKDIFVASTKVSVKANLNQNISYNDTSLSQIIMPTIKDLISSDGVIIDKAKENSGIESISAQAISVSNNEDSLIMTITYSDETPDGAKDKLNAVIKAAQEVVSEPSDEFAEKSQEAKDNLSAMMKEFKEKSKDFYENSDEYEELKSWYNIAQEALKYMQTGSSMSKYFFAIIELEPTQVEPYVSKRDNDIRTILLSTLIAMVVAVATAIIIYLISDKVVSVDALERITGKKNLICVSGKRSKHNKYSEMKPLELTQLSDALIFMKSVKKSVVYQMQSTTSGEGKSTIVANLGISLAAAGRKTLIIDCDFKKRKIRKFFKLDTCNDLTAYYKDEKSFDEIINKSGYENLDIITADSHIENHTVIFTSEKFEEMLNEAKGRYEFILLDCGPVSLISDYINISNHVDGTLLVVSCNYVKSLALKSTVKSLESCNANVIGTVFNFCNKRDYYQTYY